MIDAAIAAALAKGLRTADIKSPGRKHVGTGGDGRRHYWRDRDTRGVRLTRRD